MSRQSRAGRGGHWTAVVVAVLWVALAASPTRAYFERVVTSARIVGLGNSFVSIADDPSAILVNPAGLALISRTSALATYNRPYGVSELNESFASVAIAMPGGVLGVSWHHVGLRGALTENLISVAFARHLISTTQDASLSIGVTVDLARAEAEATALSDNVFTGSVGVLLRPFPMIGIGYSLRNVVEGDVHLLEGGPGTRLRRQQSWGLSYKWADRVTVSVDRNQTAIGEWRNHGGLEILLHPNLVLRGGVDSPHVSGGFGVLWRAVRVDLAMSSHRHLGSTYVLSVSFLPKVKNPYAQKP